MSATRCCNIWLCISVLKKSPSSSFLFLCISTLGYTSVVTLITSNQGLAISGNIWCLLLCTNTHCFPSPVIFCRGFGVWRRPTRYNVNCIISSVIPLRYDQNMQIIHFYYLHSPWHSLVLPHTHRHTDRHTQSIPTKTSAVKMSAYAIYMAFNALKVSLLGKTQTNYIWIVCFQSYWEKKGVHAV